MTARKPKMSEEKSKRVTVALTVGAVLLLVILLFVMIYQIIAISYGRKQNRELKEAIAEYNRMIAEGEDIYEARSQRWWIELRARELGYSGIDDVPLD